MQPNCALLLVAITGPIRRCDHERSPALSPCVVRSGRSPVEQSIPDRQARDGRATPKDRVRHFLPGSDWPYNGTDLAQYYSQDFTQLPLTAKEWAVIRSNVAPYAR